MRIAKRAFERNKERVHAWLDMKTYEFHSYLVCRKVEKASLPSSQQLAESSLFLNPSEN